MLTNGQKSLINSLLSEYYDETKDVKEKEFTKNLMEVLNWPPSTVESPFSKEMIEQIISDVEDIRKVVGYSDTRDKIISTCNHLLTNANEWTKMEQAFEKIKKAYEKDFYTATHFGEIVADIIKPFSSPKPKELKDLKEGDEVYAIDVCLMSDKSIEALEFGKLYKVKSVNGDIVYFDTKKKENHRFFIKELPEFFSLTSPTEQQITAAEEAAINEVKQRFDKARKEVGNG